MNINAQIEKHIVNRQFVSAYLSQLFPLIRIPSITSSEGKYDRFKKEALHFFLETAAGFGFQTENINDTLGIVTFDDHAPEIDIWVHLDVVAADQPWTKTRPFSPMLHDGIIYGRGVADDKGPAMAALYALRTLKELHLPTSKGIRLIAGTNEEGNMTADTDLFKSKYTPAPFTFTPDGCYPVKHISKASYMNRIAINRPQEPALPRVLDIRCDCSPAIVADSCSATLEGFSALELLHKVKEIEKETDVQFEIDGPKGKICSIHAIGQSNHAARADKGNNAVTAILQFLAELSLAASPQAKALHDLAKIFPHGDISGKAAGLYARDAVSGETMLNLGGLYLDEETIKIRIGAYLPLCMDKDTFQQRIKGAIEPLGITLSEPFFRPAHSVPLDDPYVQKLSNAYTTFTHQPAYGVAKGGASYANQFEHAVAFGCQMPGFDAKMHGADECMPLLDLVTSMEIITYALYSICK